MGLPQNTGKWRHFLAHLQVLKLLQSTEDILACSKLKKPFLPAPVVFCCLCLGVHLTCIWLKQGPSKKYLVTASKKREMDAGRPWGTAKGQLCELSPNIQRELLKCEEA